MDMSRLTERARKAMKRAKEIALDLNHEYIGTEHILLGILRGESGVGHLVLKSLDLDLEKVQQGVLMIVKKGPDMEEKPTILPHSPRAKNVIAYAVAEALRLNHQYVGTEHLLLGLLRVHEGVAAQTLMNMGLKLETVREKILDLYDTEPKEDDSATGELLERGQESLQDIKEAQSRNTEDPVLPETEEEAKKEQSPRQELEEVLLGLAEDLQSAAERIRVIAFQLDRLLGN